MRRHFALSVHYRRVFGRPARKVVLDAGNSCPNRGPDKAGGCVFCNPAGSGSGAFARGLSLAGQWNLARERILARTPPGKPAPALVAYVQAYTNTHGPLSKVARLVEGLAALPGLDGAAIATRPDCLDEPKAKLLSQLPGRETWLDLGLQSSCDAALARIGRGHTVAEFDRACRLAHARGLKVCAHLMAGLPGENPEALVRSAKHVAGLPVAGVKLHNLLVVRGAPLAQTFAAGEYAPLSLADYARALALALAQLPSTVVVHRLQADPAPGELVAPAWAGNKQAVLDAIHGALTQHDLWQGKHCDAPEGPPPWFTPAQGFGAHTGLVPEHARSTP